LIVNRILSVTLVLADFPATVIVYVVEEPLFPPGLVWDEPELPEEPQAVKADAAINPTARRKIDIHRDVHREGNLRFLPIPSIDRPNTPANIVSKGQLR
jgi:hypothetical protein